MLFLQLSCQDQCSSTGFTSWVYVSTLWWARAWGLQLSIASIWLSLWCWLLCQFALSLLRNLALICSACIVFWHNNKPGEKAIDLYSTPLGWIGIWVPWTQTKSRLLLELSFLIHHLLSGFKAWIGGWP